MPGYELGLTEPEAEWAGRLLRESVVISLHDHPVVFPRDITRVRDYIRGSRHLVFADQGLRRGAIMRSWG